MSSADELKEIQAWAKGDGRLTATSIVRFMAYGVILLFVCFIAVMCIALNYKEK